MLQTLVDGQTTVELRVGKLVPSMIQGPAMIAYAGSYLAVTLGLALRLFSRRDL